MRHAEFSYSGDICSINKKYVGRNFVLSKKYRAFKTAIAWKAKSAMRGSEPITGDCSIFIRFQYPLRMDIDAPIKAVLDGMKGIMIGDDKQVYNMIVQKTRGTRFKLNVEVQEMTPFPQQKPAYLMLFDWIWNIVKGASIDPV